MALGTDMARLRSLPVLSCLDEDALRLVAFSAEARALPSGHLLFRRGDPTDGAVLVVSGALALDTGHGDTRAIRQVGPGTLIDESALLAPGFRSATTTAAGTTTTVAIPRSAMMRVLEAYPSNALALRRYWAERLSRRLDAFKAATRP